MDAVESRKIITTADAVRWATGADECVSWILDQTAMYARFLLTLFNEARSLGARDSAVTAFGEPATDLVLEMGELATNEEYLALVDQVIDEYGLAAMASAQENQESWNRLVTSPA